MELVTLLRDLWRLRIYVAVVALFAVLAGSAVAFKLPSPESRKYEVGIATARVLVDTPNSQVVEVAPKGSDMLGVRANLIANLMAEGDVKAAIAERAGLKPDALIGVPESAAGPPPDLGPSPAKANVLTTRVSTTPDGDRLPIIEIEAQAPDATAAAGLAKAAITGLSDYLDSKAATEKVQDAERLRVTGLGSPQAREVVRGPRLMFAIAAALFVFCAGCAAVLMLTSLIRGWRTASELEGLEEFEGNGFGGDLAVIDGHFEAPDGAEPHRQRA